MNATLDTYSTPSRSLWLRLHIDPWLLGGLLLLAGTGLLILYSAGGGNPVLVYKQAARLGIAFTVMLALAQVHPRTLYRWSPYLYAVGIVLLVAVLGVGDVGKGARRWLDLGFVRFQPSEFVKIFTPMLVARFLAQQPLPPGLKTLAWAGLWIALPVLLIAKQPDLGTALLVATAGGAVVFYAGVSWRLLAVLAGTVLAALPVVWMLLHDYQRDRVLMFLNPEQDPLGRGYHTIQAKIAIGSGGLQGKGWLGGTQSHLEFLPEPHTDFIFAVLAEEFGLVGCTALLGLYLFIVGRGMAMALEAQDTFSRLLCGGLALTFFVYVFVNVGMVIGLLPVVGVPLPLVSYGGTSMVTLMAGFGIMMSLHTHRKLVPS
ncbi:rod shape determining protein RodA [Methylomarinovum caldicuralii]|uniref:Peptidoglycan glycosyltransferase MrdB n=1 Tax=Methylomarinovum caldicuralii TaxID=438856 RepID=A0AAU9C0V5_9GAMM|nr:rod shape-determining protein RodA [Methylomarinovum caldicuralii]BCX80760.1 rod shape determining protein RodA [Methylomarinovum caldicuralii]